MKLHIQNEFGTLKSAVVCWGENIPTFENYRTNDPEFTKYHPYSWNKDLLLKQQEEFFKLLEKYNVKLIFPKTIPHLLWQMYTRDTAFVIDNKLYYSPLRKLQARNGEVDSLLDTLNIPEDQIVTLKAEIEGGDILVTSKKSIYIGHGSRTTNESIRSVGKYVQTKTFELGKNVMHLDTRLTLLPKNIVLAYLNAFDKHTVDYLNSTYKVIEITDDAVEKLGVNVFIINPETILVPLQHARIRNVLKDEGFKVEMLSYTEPINLGGSFRCTTLPIERA